MKKQRVNIFNPTKHTIFSFGVHKLNIYIFWERCVLWKLQMILSKTVFRQQYLLCTPWTIHHLSHRYLCRINSYSRLNHRLCMIKMFKTWNMTWKKKTPKQNIKKTKKKQKNQLSSPHFFCEKRSKGYNFSQYLGI